MVRCGYIQLLNFNCTRCVQVCNCSRSSFSSTPSSFACIFFSPSRSLESVRWVLGPKLVCFLYVKQQTTSNISYDREGFSKDAALEGLCLKSLCGVKEGSRYRFHFKCSMLKSPCFPQARGHTLLPPAAQYSSCDYLNLQSHISLRICKRIFK